MKMRTGVIVDFCGSWSSGIAELVVKCNGEIIRILCDNAATVRALASISPDVIAPGHMVNISSLFGRKIRFATDEFGLLTCLGGEE